MELKEALAREIIEIEVMPLMMTGLAANFEAMFPTGEISDIIAFLQTTKSFKELVETMVAIYTKMEVATLNSILAYCKSDAATASKRAAVEMNAWMVENGARLMHSIEGALSDRYQDMG